MRHIFVAIWCGVFGGCYAFATSDCNPWWFGVIILGVIVGNITYDLWEKRND